MMNTAQIGRISEKARRPRLRHVSMNGWTTSQNSGMVPYTEHTSIATMSMEERSDMNGKSYAGCPMSRAFRDVGALLRSPQRPGTVTVTLPVPTLSKRS